ncbi:hypothetical protein BN79_097 [Yersinia phage phiR2-01]|uniref:Tail length tape-measure protein n=1 Tax=Yersinia phage phiR2-01 TaxID=1206557 RepID=I7K2N7_9CAUD|nr:hypothetical protein BN79_097 [Yersinia phage phiR2-01]CCI88506.1 hypothetical protein BN79_097 [Yersinia phage phiR2-01]
MFSNKKPRSVVEIVASFTTITDELQARIEEDQKTAASIQKQQEDLAVKLKATNDSEKSAQSIKDNIFKLLGK